MLKLSPVEHRASAPARIGVLDRNRAVLTRAARVASAAALERVAAETDPAALREQLAADTQRPAVRCRQCGAGAGARESRTMPTSLHVYDHAELGAGG